jgi:hypothetical protein
VDADVLIDDEFHPGQQDPVTLLIRQTFPPAGFSPFDLSM